MRAGPEKTTKIDAVDGTRSMLPATKGGWSEEVEEGWQQDPLVDVKFWSGDVRAPRSRLDDVRACKDRESKSLETYGHMFVGGLDTNDQDEAGD